MRRRVVVTGLVAALALSVAGRAGALQREAADTEPVLVELRLGRLGAATVAAYRVRTEVLIPVTQLLSLAEARYRVTPDGRLEAEVFGGGGRLVVDAAEDTMTLGAHRVPVGPEFKLFRRGELYVGAERLGDVLGVRLLVDWTELTVTVSDPSRFPIARRLARENARDAFLRRRVGVRPDAVFALERPRWDGLVIDYSFLAPSQDPLGGGAYAAGLGADALGGSLEVGVAGVGPAHPGTARVEASWTGVWRDLAWLQQARLGDGLATGRDPLLLRGAAVTNAPYLRSSAVGAVDYAGALPAGWTIEAYRGGDLIAFDSVGATGRFAVELPVLYGENPVDFVAYGPFGEVRAFNRTYRVLSELLPARRLEYGLSAGTCRDPRCGGLANVDLRYGASPRWTFQAGAQRFWRDSLPDRLHPYVGVTGTPTNAWAVVFEGVGGALARGLVRYEPTAHLRVSATYTRYAGDAAPVLTPAGRRREWGVTGFWRPDPHTGFAFLEGGAQGAVGAAGAQTRARLGASFQAGPARVLPFVRWERDAQSAGEATTRTLVGATGFLLPNPARGRILGRIWARGTAELDAGRAGEIAAAALSVARELTGGVRLEAGASWARGGVGLTYTVLVTSYLPMVRAHTSVTAAADGAAVASQSVQGSIVWDGATRRLTLAPGPSLERSGVAGHVFVDDNGNGRRDPGEAGVADVRVVVGVRTAQTDSGGLYRVWDLVPFEPLLVSLDSLSLPSPLLAPAFTTASLVPGPNRFRALDIALVRAGVIEGRVLRPDGRGVGGATLVLMDTRTGAVRRFATFSDGAFYVMGVKPGAYELAVTPDVLEALGVAAEPVRFTLTPGVEGVGRAGLDLRLRPRS